MAQTLRTMVVTWNVGNAPPPACLDDLVPKDGGEMDLVVVGMQECSYTAAKDSNAVDKITLHSGKTASPYDFIGALQFQLGEEWEVLENPEVMEMRLVVFARKELHDQISDVQSAWERTGIGHALGNKGGLAVRFRFEGSTIAFVSCHLAAHEGPEHRNRRNSDCEEVLSGTSFGWENADMLAQTDHVIWMGDLNYRLDLGLGDPDLAATLKAMKSKEERAAFQFKRVKDQIDAGNFAELWVNDELTKEIKDGKVFHGFTEATCMEGGMYCFHPTFKVKRTNVAPEVEYTNQRTPSWCDRVLWRSCLLYTSDAADEEDSVDLGGRRIIKKKKKVREHSRGIIARGEDNKVGM
eukprot:TRINITY_DN2679_c0_g1_i2.p1 TRINITY_DN2679_c0_g1~~TRINITY_DN2679_c0_g1_i2.p1  ORF type:complete len:352 (-),score=109.58 TRINITY_DN2679_c0_g1_i2:45-1100(-)